MGTARYSWLSPIAAATMLGIVAARYYRIAAEQSIALGLERREHLQLIGLQDENRRLESRQLSDADRRRLESRHAEADVLRARLGDLQRKTPDGGDGEPHSVLAKDWAYAGRASPKATIESVLWAASRGETDRLADLLGFAPELRAQAETMFSELPAASQQEYGRPEKVVATLLAGSFPKDAQASQVFIDRQFGDQDASITMAVTHSDGQTRSNLFRFHNTPEGWQLLIPANVLNDYEKTLLADQQAPETSAP